MVRVERPKGRKKSSSPRGESNRNFEDNYKSDGTSRSSGRRSNDRRSSGRGSNDRRDSGRGPSRFGRNRSDIEMTKVICSSCGVECEVPFKPTSTKPVYCSDCFAKKDKDTPNKPSNKDLDIINEKLNKIMKALKIE